MFKLKYSGVIFVFLLLISMSTISLIPQVKAQTPVLTNLIWTQLGDEVQSDDIAFYKSMNMTGVIVQAGSWGSDNQIHVVSENIPDLIEEAVINAHAQGLRCYIWISSQSNTGNGLIDLSTSGARSDAAESIESFMNSLNPMPDGFDDDVEEMSISAWADMVLYWNLADNVLDSLGKEYFVSTFPHWLINDFENEQSGLSAQIDVDSINLMMYGGYPNTEQMYKDFITDVPPIVTSPIHYVMRAEYDQYFPFRSGDGGVTFADVLDWYDSVLTELPIGFSIFWELHMDSTQWDAWANWSTKNNLVSQEPTPTPNPTVTATPTITPTATPVYTSPLTINLQAIVILLALIFLIVLMGSLMMSAIKNHKTDNLIVSIVAFILIVITIYIMIQTGLL